MVFYELYNEPHARYRHLFLDLAICECAIDRVDAVVAQVSDGRCTHLHMPVCAHILCFVYTVCRLPFAAKM